MPPKEKGQKKPTVKAENKSKKAKTRKSSPNPGCRAKGKALKMCFSDGEKIRHKGACPNIGEGHFSANAGGIIYKGELYKALSAFANDHYDKERKDRTDAANGWLECEVFRNGDWVSTYNLKAKL